MTINVKFDAILGKLRESDVGLVSVASVPIPDPLIINNLQVASSASLNLLHLNNLYASTASLGNLTTNNIANTSNASFNTIHTNSLFASTATLGYTHISTIDWNLTSGVTLSVEGQMNWDSVNQAVVVGMAGGNVDVALGLETLFPKRVKNSTATTMPKGSLVYINGVSGNDPTVTFAIATRDMTSAYTLGMTAENISAGQKGWVTTHGEVAGLDLSAFTGGDTLYLSGATAGLFTNVAPKAPLHYVRVGTVVKATPDGSLVVNVINGFETDELHDVVIASLASGQILQSGVSSLWYNRSLASAINELNLLASLGSLAVMNQLSFTSLTNQPSLGSLAFQNNISLGSLAVMNQLSFTSLTNQPSLSSLAFQATIDYTSAQLLNKPSLGSLAAMNQLSFTSLTNQPSLGSLAFQNAVSLGSLAVMNELSFTSLTNQPSLSSLAFQSTIDYTSVQLTNKPSLGSLAAMNQLSFTSLTNQPSLGSLAFQNVVSLGSLAILNRLTHASLTSLLIDDHTQYALLAGRSGGQIIYGGTNANNALTLVANSAASGNSNNSTVLSFNTGNLGANVAMSIKNNGMIDVPNGISIGSPGFQMGNTITFGAGTYIFQDDGTGIPYAIIRAIGTTVDIPQPTLTIGTNPATTGVIGIPNNNNISGRNAANTADIAMFKVNTSNQVQAGAALNMGTFPISNATTIAVGATPAGSGTIRIGNNQSIVARNAANNGDVTMFSLNTSNLIQGGTDMDMNNNYIKGVTNLALYNATQSNSGITFPATAVDSTDVHTLDDYEEGTWTPVARGRNVAGTGTYTAQSGRYVKIGKTVYYEGRCTWTALSGASGGLCIGGLPLTLNATYYGAVALGVWNIVTSANTFPMGTAIISTQLVALKEVSTAGTGAAADVALRTTGDIILSGFYAV